MKCPKKTLWTLASIVVTLLLICAGIKLFDGRSPQAVAVHELIGIRALNVKKYEADKVGGCPYSRLLRRRRGRVKYFRRAGRTGKTPRTTRRPARLI